MKDGEICEQGDTEALFATPRHPYTRELLDAIPDIAATAPIEATLPA